MANLFIDINNNLGENILYNELDKSLYWIDINEKKLYIYNLDTVKFIKYEFSHKPCSYCFTNKDGILLIAFEDGFYLFNKYTQQLEPIESTYKQIEMCRLNDGKADPYGNFICGGFSELYPQDLWLVSNNNKSVCNISNSPKHTIWNATCFSTDKRYMYCTDSPKKELWRYNYDIHNKSIDNKKVIYDLGDKDMVFDGACVDRDDYIWIAMYNGSCVYRISPDGILDTVVGVPSDKYVTSVCIGGKDMDTLFIVTGHFGEMNNTDINETHTESMINETHTESMINETHTESMINGFIYSYKLDKPLGVFENRFILP
jgi:sugar lactone lactonase YvrE